MITLHFDNTPFMILKHAEPFPHAHSGRVLFRNDSIHVYARSIAVFVSYPRIVIFALLPIWIAISGTKVNAFKRRAIGAQSLSSSMSGRSFAYCSHRRLSI
ncbi:hypothetical protein PENTCL1PPCAC_20569 [Pristionchus entomophagus]|uniref:G protein-coupled receptor n=1 Tax=Pristionchus entomophagus TaxID=358040 RepID=A0AAV5TWP6_9BILA|nr:hypothetical protein PENTCL1PPCAC_20569 [Pristionchus entomophagus]